MRAPRSTLQQPFYKWFDQSIMLLVLTVGVSCAAVLLSRFLSHPRLLWSNVIHDRNAHLLSGMNLASHLRQGQWTKVIGDLDSFRTWPPLHDGLCVGLSVGLGQNDERWAILPSLIAWIGSAVLAYLLANAASSRGGKAAGLLAALFVLTSPAQRAYATDVMLESLGACLTLACLYAYVVARKTDSPGAYRNLAIALTLLFLEKYNYWTLAVIGLLVDWITSCRHNGINSFAASLRLSVLQTRDTFQKGVCEAYLARSAHSKGIYSVGPTENAQGVRTWLIRQSRNPLNYLLSVLLVLIVVIILVPWNETTLFGKRVLLQPPANLMTIAYAVLLIRLAPWYLRIGRMRLAQSGHRVRALFAWHIWPIALWFLWPHHLYSFLWVNSPAANGGEFPHHDVFGGYPFYGNCLLHDYHIGLWSVIGAICLFLIGCRAAVQGRLRPGAAAVFWLVGFAFVLTVHHPNRKSRFLHTWLPVAWVGAGIGAGSLKPTDEKQKNALQNGPQKNACCPEIVDATHLHQPAQAGFVNGGRGFIPVLTLCYIGGIGLFAVAHLPGLWAEAHAPEGGISSPASSYTALDITDAYLLDLSGSRSVAVFSNLPLKEFAQWTYMQRYAGRKRLETDVKGFNPLAADNTACFNAWLGQTGCDTIVYLDFRPGTLFYRRVPGCENLGQYGILLQKQIRYTVAVRHLLPLYGCTVTVWKQTPLR